VPLGFSPLCSREPAQEASVVLPLLGSTGAKILKLEEVIGEQMEAEGRALAEAMAEHVLRCFWS
jgi:predicted type IV restriction endonuclease